MCLTTEIHSTVFIYEMGIVVVQSLSHVPLSVTPWTAARQVSLSFTISWSLLKLMSIELVMPSVVPFSSCLQSFPSSGSLMSQLFHIKWPKYWKWNFSISPFSEYSGLISFRIDWFDLIDVQGTLKSLLQHHSSNSSILWHSAYFMVQPYMSTGKIIA